MLSIFVVVVGCSSGEVDISVESDTIEAGKWIAQVNKDLARYEVGDTVKFELTLQEEVKRGELIVHYSHLDEKIEEQVVEVDGQSVSWEWTPEGEDFTGYMVEIFLVSSGDVIDHDTIAVDVSSDWAKFPRYGYLADFYRMEAEYQQDVIANLNRFHINGLQFYDWQDVHEQPVPFEENGEVKEMWYDLANREVYLETVERYIDLAHERNMMAMNYNLLFGASKHFEDYGVKKEWGIFKDQFGQNQDFHPVPPAWKYDIYLFDPGNEDWQNLMFERQRQVFDNLNFDGWHVDQLGNRSPWYTYDGKQVNMPLAYRSILENAKDELDVRLVLNAVSMYGQEEIAKSPVEFLYVESWDEPLYEDLKEVVDYNLELTDGELATIFAAYINFDLSDSLGEFNTPGVLFRDAVIFAAGGHNISLGENMLSKEYFPHKRLEITDELQSAMISYYDFSVAYQNLLRDGVVDVERKVTSNDLSISQHAEMGAVWNFVKEKDNKDILHFLNFVDTTSLEWNDTNGTQPEPQLIEDTSLTVEVDKEVDKVWMASPDVYKGASVELEFTEENGELSFTLPSLKYWDMVVIEYK